MKYYRIKKTILEPYIEESPIPERYADTLFVSRDVAALIAAQNVYDEIGHTMDDLKGECAYVVSSLAHLQCYSFANVVWQIEEVEQ